MKIHTIGIIGAGAMGSGIAQVAATHGHQVVIYDSYEPALEKSAVQLTKTLETLVSKGKLDADKSEQIVSSIRRTQILDDLKASDLIIEAIIENAEIKKQVLQQVERIVSDQCIITSNTSSITLTSLASALERPSMFCGLHFFNPAPVMKLVEVIPALQTNVEITKILYACMQDWKKVPVYAKDTPGFIVNRVARPYYSEALRIYDEGLAGPTQIDTAMKEIGGFKMGPFELMDFIGHDVNYRVTESVFQAMYFDPRYKPSQTQKSLLDAGWYGRKSNRGFYTYPSMEETMPLATEKLSSTDIFNRIIAMLINEAADAVYYRICSADDVDHAMVNGANYPKGLMAWGQEIGMQKVNDIITALYHEYLEDRYRPSQYFKNL